MRDRSNTREFCSRRTVVPWCAFVIAHLCMAVGPGLAVELTPSELEIFEEGGHGVGNLIPTRVKHGFPPARWPELMLSWLDTVFPPEPNTRD